MTNSKNTKRALLASVLSVVLCVAMLIGSTFAWFTDSVTSGKNQIVAGNLDVELEYTTDFNEWKTVEDATDLFKKDALWEPGHAEVVYLRMRNAGTLALKYKFGMNIVSENDATNVNGETFKLSQYLQYGVVEGQQSAFADRSAAIAAVENPTSLAGYSKEGTMLAEAEPQYLALVVYMPETVGNEANYRGDVVPTIDLGLNLVATQTPHESDSFGSDYDKDAYRDLILTQNTDGSYSAGNEKFVKINEVLIPVTADENVSGLYHDENGNAYTGSSTALKETFANGDENITLINNFTLSYRNNNESGTPDTYILTENAVIDLNGKTLTIGTNDRFMLAGDNITIKNGTIKAGTVYSSGKLQKIAYSLGVTAGSKNVVIENIDCEGGIEALGNGATVTLRNVTSNATTYYNMYLAGGATATIESGDFTHVDKVHFYTQTANDKVIVNGGTFSGGSPTHSGAGKLENNLA